MLLTRLVVAEVLDKGFLTSIVVYNYISGTVCELRPPNFVFIYSVGQVGLGGGPGLIDHVT